MVVPGWGSRVAAAENPDDGASVESLGRRVPASRADCSTKVAKRPEVLEKESHPARTSANANNP